jgi:hypothetical protein
VIIGRIGECGALRMAQAIARRHARIGATARSLPLVLRHVRPFSINHYRVVRPCSFAPRLSFHLTANRPPEMLVSPVTERAPERVEQFSAVIRERYVRLPSVIEPARAHRASPETFERPSLLPGPLPGRRAGAPERVLAKPVVAAPAAPALPTEMSAAASAVPTARAAVAAPPAPDVNRLANEVLKVIDKRVIAYRERAGRR